MTLPRVDLIRSELADWLILNNSDHIGNFVRSHGVWGAKEVSIARVFIRGRRDLNVIDVGANLGGFTIPVGKELAKNNGRVYSFEPQRVVFQQLCANVFINRLDNVYAYNLALGEDSKKLEIPELDFQKSGNIGGFSIDSEIRKKLCTDALNGSTFSNVETEQVYVVEQKSLDRMDFGFDIHLIKADIEGSELEFFRGAVNKIKQSNFPPIIFELWEGRIWYEEKAKHTKEILMNWGYRFDYFGREILAQHPDHKWQCKVERNGDAVKLTLTQG